MYEEFRTLARARLRSGGRSVLLDTTSLVNEWYVRFAQIKGVEIESRLHLMRYAASAMRSIISTRSSLLRKPIPRRAVAKRTTRRAMT